MTRVSRRDLPDVPTALPTARRLRPSDRRDRSDSAVPSLVAPRRDENAVSEDSPDCDEENVRGQLALARQHVRALEELVAAERAGILARDRQIEWLERQILELKQSLRDANLMLLAMEDPPTSAAR